MLKKHKLLHHLRDEPLVLEVMLVIVVCALTVLVHKFEGFKLVVLNLFFLPVVLSAFFLGRYRAGVLAVLSVLAASLVMMLQMHGFAANNSPLSLGLAVTIWGAVLCLTALLVGTLSDERRSQSEELHEAYVGVVEVLSKYLQGGNAQLKARTQRVAELSQRVATVMRLSPKRIDDVRVAALMHDMGKVEVTTKVISRAVDSLESHSGRPEDYSFQGIDLVHSLGTVLRGAIPILLNQDHALPSSAGAAAGDVPLGAKIIRAVRAYDILTEFQHVDRDEALTQLRRDHLANHDSDILDAIERATAEFSLVGI